MSTPTDPLRSPASRRTFLEGSAGAIAAGTAAAVSLTSLVTPVHAAGDDTKRDSRSASACSGTTRKNISRRSVA